MCSDEHLDTKNVRTGKNIQSSVGFCTMALFVVSDLRRASQTDAQADATAATNPAATTANAKAVAARRDQPGAGHARCGRRGNSRGR
jgi:hypothetical protein